MSQEGTSAEEVKSRVIAMLKRKQWNEPQEQIWCVPGVGVKWLDGAPFTYWRNPETGQKIDLVDAAQKNEIGPMLWLTLTGRCADYIRQGQPLPTQFREFAAKLMLGEVSRPKARSHSKNGTSGPFKLDRRNFVICVGMAALNKVGYALENGARGLQSASEIVANEMDGIEAVAAYAIWRKNKKRFSETLLWEIALERLYMGSDEHSRLMEWADKVDAKRKRRALSEAAAFKDGHKQNTVK